MKKIHTPFIGFINKPYPYGSITQYYGENPDMYRKICPIAGQCLQGHNGIDIVAPYGTPLLAVEDGVIYEVNDDTGGYGRHVRIFTQVMEDGYRHEWTYGHLSKILCTKGQIVKRGDVIGLMGNSGFVVTDPKANGFWSANPFAGTHVHLGLREYDKHSNVLNYDNGEFGSIDFAGLLPESDQGDVDTYNTVLNMNKLLIILQNANITIKKP